MTMDGTERNLECGSQKSKKSVTFAIKHTVNFYIKTLGNAGRKTVNLEAVRLMV